MGLRPTHAQTLPIRSSSRSQRLEKPDRGNTTIAPDRSEKKSRL
jgi:hypothetical protein